MLLLRNLLSIAKRYKAFKPLIFPHLQTTSTPTSRNLPTPYCPSALRTLKYSFSTSSNSDPTPSQQLTFKHPQTKSLFSQAQLHYYNDNIPHALSLFQQALSIEPNNIPLLKRIQILYFQQHLLPQAKTLNQRILQSIYTPQQILEQKLFHIILNAASGDKKETLEQTYKQLEEDYPDYSTDHHRELSRAMGHPDTYAFITKKAKAQRLLDVGNKKAAIKYFKEIMEAGYDLIQERREELIMCLLNLGNMYDQEQKKEKTLRCLEKVRELEKQKGEQKGEAETAEELEISGITELKRGNIDIALQYIQRAKELNPNEQRYDIEILECYLQSGRLQECLNLAQNFLLKPSPSSSLFLPECNRIISQVYTKQNNIHKAIEYVTKQISLSSKSPISSHIRRYQLYLRVRDFERAISDITFIINNPSPTDPIEIPPLFINRGFCWEKLGDYEKAIADVTWIIETEGRNSPYLDRAYNDRAFYYLRYGNYEKGLQNCEAALERNEEQPGVYFVQGRCYCGLKNYEKARKSLEKLRRFGEKVFERELEELIRKGETS